MLSIRMLLVAGDSNESSLKSESLAEDDHVAFFRLNNLSLLLGYGMVKGRALSDGAI